MARRWHHAVLMASALAPLAAASVLAGPNNGNVVGGAATIQGQGTANVIVNQVDPERHHQLADVQHRLGRDDENLHAEFELGRARSRHRRPRPVADPRHAVLERQGLSGQSGRHPVRHGRAHQCRQPGGDHQRHRQQRLHGRALQFQHSGQSRTLQSSIWGRSRRKPVASPLWSRRACATPAQSSQSSARSRSRPATRSRSTCMATI